MNKKVVRELKYTSLIVHGYTHDITYSQCF